MFYRIHKYYLQTKRILIAGKINKNTGQEISDARYRQATLTSATLIAARILNVAIGIGSIPLTLDYLGTDQFGIWMALTGFASFLSFTDLGMGAGVQNALITCKGKDDYKSPSQIVGAGLITLIIVGILLAVISISVVPKIQFEDFIKFKDPKTISIAAPTMQALLLAFAIGLPAGLVQRICDAYQRGYWGYSMLILGRAASFITIVAAVHFDLGLPILAFSFVATPSLFYIIGYFYVTKKMPWLTPSWSLKSLERLKNLMRTGILVLFTHIGYATLNSSPAIIIANQIDAASVTPFTITQKVLGAATLIISPILQSFWGAIGEAAIRGDINWIKNNNKKMMKIIIITMLPFAIISIIFGKYIINLWSGNADAVPSQILLVLCVSTIILNTLDQRYSVALNALNLFGYRAASMLLFSVIGYSIIIFSNAPHSIEYIVFVFLIFSTLPVVATNSILLNRQLKYLNKNIN